MEVFDIYRALWRRRYLIVILSVLMTAAAWAVSSSQTKVYKASALIRVQQRITDPTQAGSALSVSQHLAQTYAQIVSTYSIDQRIYRQLDGRVPQDEIHVQAQPVQDLELLWISATSTSPEHAAAVANAAPDALRSFISETGTLRDQIVSVDKAGVPGTAISPRPVRTAVLALLVALVFNGTLALLLEFLSDRLPEIDELDASLGKPVLGTVPQLTFRSPVVDQIGHVNQGPRAGRSLTTPAPASAPRARRGSAGA